MWKRDSEGLKKIEGIRDYNEKKKKKKEKTKERRLLANETASG